MINHKKQPFLYPVAEQDLHAISGGGNCECFIMSYDCWGTSYTCYHHWQKNRSVVVDCFQSCCLTVASMEDSLAYKYDGVRETCADGKAKFLRKDENKHQW